MKILLVSTNTVQQPYPTYPLGLDYVMNAISPPHQVICIDMNEVKESEAIAAVLADFSPDVVGISIRNIDNTDDTHTEAFIGKIGVLIDIVRRYAQGVIVLGGSGFTILPEEFMARLDADFGVIGEGERFPLLLQALERQESVTGLPGIITGKGPAVFPEPLPAFFRRGVIPDHSYRSYYLKRGGMLNLQTKRGCPFRCIYCTYPHIEGRRLRFAEPADVGQTARKLQEAGAKYLYITDSTFNGHYEHSLDVAMAFKKAGLSIPWGGFFTPTAPPPDYYRILADTGLTHVEFGTESLADPTLRAYGKPFRMEDVFISHRLAGAAGLHVAHYLMVGGPGENRDTLEETLSRAERLDKTVFFVFAGIRIYPHTDLHTLALQTRQLKDGDDLMEPKFYWSPALHRETVLNRMKDHAANRENWVIGSGSPRMYRMMSRLYARGHIGPLWEHLTR
ncbi:MAG: lipid biosynthesis B12-binding/radical SAM protein [Pseudomonadota bacterium]